MPTLILLYQLKKTSKSNMTETSVNILRMSHFLVKEEELLRSKINEHLELLMLYIDIFRTIAGFLEML